MSRKVMSRTQRVKNYLNRRGSINTIQGWKTLGLVRLGAIIFNLREDGWEIDTDMVTVKNHLKEDVTVAKYTLVDSPE